MSITKTQLQLFIIMLYQTIFFKIAIFLNAIYTTVFIFVLNNIIYLCTDNILFKFFFKKRKNYFQSGAIEFVVYKLKLETIRF